MSTRTPARYHRLYLPLTLGRGPQQKVVDFLFDSGATLTCISSKTAELARQANVVLSEGPTEALTSASGDLMPSTCTMEIEFALQDGLKFSSKCHVIEDLVQDGLLGQNVIASLQLIPDLDNNEIVRGPQIVGGSRLAAECMAVQDKEDSVEDLVLQGPIVDLSDPPLAPHDQLYTFHPCSDTIVPPRHFAKVMVQTFNPDQSRNTGSMDVIMSVAPNGSLEAHTVDQGMTYVIVTNATNSHQKFPTNLPIATGCSIKTLSLIHI